METGRGRALGVLGRAREDGDQGVEARLERAVLDQERGDAAEGVELPHPLPEGALDGLTRRLVAQRANDHRTPADDVVTRIAR